MGVVRFDMSKSGRRNEANKEPNLSPNSTHEEEIHLTISTCPP